MDPVESDWVGLEWVFDWIDYCVGFNDAGFQMQCDVARSISSVTFLLWLTPVAFPPPFQLIYWMRVCGSAGIHLYRTYIYPAFMYLFRPTSTAINISHFYQLIFYHICPASNCFDLSYLDRHYQVCVRDPPTQWHRGVAGDPGKHREWFRDAVEEGAR